ncbi:hypothetical protein MA5S0304_0810 [Mycobacteroides abscessus 5S-0304]|uniref:Uncharacterized protein n=1 Tax=Mycobacteroides abscessus subsp. bolletii 1513 TaxID=1299321 RepID=X8DSY4_9MYCO|nr:hypothetical protein MA5S0304_0810 [Mycobacteroides abscessus 5S-0304]EUA70798.1 hypothetical protein I540_1822 [Mycobacteroides abscessus subsp. bolletii 1513]
MAATGPPSTQYLNLPQWLTRALLRKWVNGSKLTPQRLI